MWAKSSSPLEQLELGLWSRAETLSSLLAANISCTNRSISFFWRYGYQYGRTLIGSVSGFKITTWSWLLLGGSGVISLKTDSNSPKTSVMNAGGWGRGGWSRPWYFPIPIRALHLASWRLSTLTSTRRGFCCDLGPLVESLLSPRCQKTSLKFSNPLAFCPIFELLHS